MNSSTGITGRPGVEIPPDDPQRQLTLAQPDQDGSLPHVGVVGGTDTILLSGDDTNGRFCLIDMHVPPGGGPPPPHRHDFEETFIILEGEVGTTFRSRKSVVRAGDTINIPSNAPHQFHNSSSKPVRLLCLCSPAGQENFFLQIGIPVETRTTPPPKPDKDAQEKMQAKTVVNPLVRHHAERRCLRGGGHVHGFQRHSRIVNPKAADSVIQAHCYRFMNVSLVIAFYIGREPAKPVTAFAAPSLRPSRERSDWLPLHRKPL